jgi:hypothetical protein
MRINIRIKAAGKRRAILETQPMELPDGLETPGDIIGAIVRLNVQAYNAKQVDAPFFPALSEEQFADGAYLGKIGFGDRKNPRQQDEEEAVRNALQCFADGLYLFLVNDAQIESEKVGEPLALKEGDTLTFIRLVMLAGSYW